jgi:hypothetical protein
MSLEGPPEAFAASLVDPVDGVEGVVAGAAGLDSSSLSSACWVLEV